MNQNEIPVFEITDGKQKVKEPKVMKESTTKHTNANEGEKKTTKLEIPVARAQKKHLTVGPSCLISDLDMRIKISGSLFVNRISTRAASDDYEIKEQLGEGRIAK